MNTILKTKKLVKPPLKPFGKPQPQAPVERKSPLILNNPESLNKIVKNSKRIKTSFVETLNNLF